MKKIAMTLLLALVLALPSLAGGTVKEIDQHQFNQLVGIIDGDTWTQTAKRPCVVDFNADWCGPCRRLAPILKEVAAMYPDIDFYSVNVDNNPELSKQLGIDGIPMLLILPAPGKGDPGNIDGFVPKEELIRAIEQTVYGK